VSKNSLPEDELKKPGFSEKPGFGSGNLTLQEFVIVGNLLGSEKIPWV
jgi:hypothetical protein